MGSLAIHTWFSFWLAGAYILCIYSVVFSNGTDIRRYLLGIDLGSIFAWFRFGNFGWKSVATPCEADGNIFWYSSG